MDRLAQVCERIASTNSRKRKVALLAGYLRELDDGDLKRAVAFLTHHPVLQAGDVKLSIGGATLRDAALEATGWDAETWAVCQRECGDTAETIGLLLLNQPGSEPLSLTEAEEYYARLLAARQTARKIDILREVMVRRRPLTVRYFLKGMGRDFRIGLQDKMVEEALAAACGVELEAVRGANNRIGLLWRVAEAARRGELEQIEARLFHPMDFMLAKPMEAMSQMAEPSEWWVEDKYDGMRAQIHRSRGQVRIFTRGMEEATNAFPEIVAAMSGQDGAAVFDGEIVAWREERALPFAMLQQRMARKKTPEKLREEIPAVFIAYDLLYQDGHLLLGLPIEERRSRLEREVGIRVSPWGTYGSAEELETMWAAARERGNEGLVLKRRGSVYEPGKRSGLWCKVKKPYGALDVVITAAEQGHGKRATMLSDYTFAVRDGERLVNVGKAYSGLTDAEIRELTRILRGIATERFGRVVLVKPEIVLEVAFDGVQASPRHKSGYALRFPRILQWRRDKKPEEADTLDTVKRLYEAAFR